MSPRQSPARLLVALSLVCLLPACGFALRGSETVAADGTTVHLRAAEPGSALVQTLSEALLAAEVMLSPSATNDGLQLQLGAESLLSRPGSVNSRARAAQYDVEMSVEVMLERGGSVIFGPLRVATQRSYYEDLSTIAGSSEEVVLLQQEMRQELAQQVLRRLRAALAEQGA